MYELKDFYYLGHKLRVVIIDDDTFYFVASDVCKMLGLTGGSVRQHILDSIPENERIKAHELQSKYRNSHPHNPYKRNVTQSNTTDHKMGCPFNKLNYQATLVTEAGLYRLIMRSNKPEAKRYQKWVFEDVLPSLHRTGTYTTPGMENTPIVKNVLQEVYTLHQPQISEPAQQESKSHKVAHVKSEISCERSIKIGEAVLNISLTLPTDTTSEKFFSINSVLSSSFDLLAAEIVKIVSRKY